MFGQGQERLGARCVRMDRLVVAGAYTSPVRANLATALLPTSHLTSLLCCVVVLLSHPSPADWTTQWKYQTMYYCVFTTIPRPDTSVVD
jgi:hypothetical protein